MLRLGDIMGRTGRAFILDLPGVAELDLSRLAPGIYLDSLDGTVPPPHRKLVLTARLDPA